MRKKTLIAVLLVFALLVTGMLVACNDKCTEHVDEDYDLICDVCDETLSSDGPNGGAQAVDYTVNIKNVAGLGMKGLVVFVRDVNTNAMVEAFTTNENGTDTKKMAPGNYYLEISASNNLPAGYVKEDRYSFNANNVADIVLTTEVVSGAHQDYKVGSVMRDFTVNTTEGETFKLSEALKTNKGVLLNFFYTSCDPCIKEFPYLDEAAGMYKDKGIAVVAVDTYGDTFEDVKLFRTNQGVQNVKMGVHSRDLFDAFNSTGYPTSVMIDRYGVICLVEIGTMPYLYPWTQMFEHFSADNYQQKLFSSMDELTPQEKPNVTQPASSEVAAVMSGSGIGDVTYYPETESADAEYCWPFVLTEKEGAPCMATSNPYKYNSVCVMHVDVPLQQNQALSLDYICSTERGGDYFYVLVNGEVIYTLSGADEVPTWKTLFPYVATEDGTYKVSFIYNKDIDSDSGDDRVYIKNLSVVDKDSITVPTYIPRNAVSEPNELKTAYENHVNAVFNEEDGYYHVNSVDGPLLLANIMNYVLDDKTDERTSIYLYALENGFKVDGVDYYPDFERYASYASNSEIGGYCTVNAQLKGLLEKMSVEYPGGVRDTTANGWLRFCKYYDAYGSNGVQLSDPIAGLAPFSAYDLIVDYNEVTIGTEPYVGEYPNAVTYNTIIMPRGKIFSFVPEKSGVYRILSTGTKELNGWIFDEQSFYTKEYLYASDNYERLTDTNRDGSYSQIEYGAENVCMTYYFEEGKEYFINVAYYDVNETGTVNFRVEYLGETYTMFRYASPAPFTFYVDPTTGEPPIGDDGEEEYTTIAGGVVPVLGNDGYFYAGVLNEDGEYVAGKSKLYVDMTLPMITGIYKKTLKEALDAGVFNFTLIPKIDTVTGKVVLDENKNVVYETGVDASGNSLLDENDKPYILVVKDVNGNKTEIKDRTAELQEYFDTKLIKSDGVYGSENTLAAGCIPVDVNLAVILQYFMDKTSFRGIENSWTKLCYYFEYLGAEENA